MESVSFYLEIKIVTCDIMNEIENRKDYESYGIKHFRFVFTDENQEEVKTAFRAYNR